MEVPRRPPDRLPHKATLAAAALLAGEAEALTRTAIELALAGDPTAMRLCLQPILPHAANAPSSSPCCRSRAPPRDEPVG
jgi:hypothetical protein